MNSVTPRINSAAPIQLMGNTASPDKPEQYQNSSSHSWKNQTRRGELDVNSQGSQHQQNKTDIRIGDGIDDPLPRGGAVIDNFGIACVQRFFAGRRSG